MPASASIPPTPQPTTGPLPCASGGDCPAGWSCCGPPYYGSGDGQLNRPFDVAVIPPPTGHQQPQPQPQPAGQPSGQPSGQQIAVADCGNHRIAIFDYATGSFVQAFGSFGAASRSRTRLTGGLPENYRCFWYTRK